MRITYRTLAALIAKMDENQKDSDVTVEITGECSCECYSAELRIAGEDHDGGLDDNHPVIYAHVNSSDHVRRDDIEALAVDLGIQDNSITLPTSFLIDSGTKTASHGTRHHCNNINDLEDLMRQLGFTPMPRVENVSNSLKKLNLTCSSEETFNYGGMPVRACTIDLIDGILTVKTQK